MNRIKHGSKKHACIAVFKYIFFLKKNNLNTKKDIDLTFNHAIIITTANFLLFNNNIKKNLFTLTIIYINN